MRKIYSLLVVLAALALCIKIDRMEGHMDGGINYSYFPFPVKVWTCGSYLGADESCTYPYVWWGIVASFLFWLLVLGLAYVVGKNKRVIKGNR